MKLNNINPFNLVDDLIKNNIAPSAFTVINDLRTGEYVAENVEVVFHEDVDMDIVKTIIDNLDNTPPTPQASLEDYLLDLEFRLLMLELGL